MPSNTYIPMSTVVTDALYNETLQYGIWFCTTVQVTSAALVIVAVWVAIYMKIKQRRGSLPTRKDTQLFAVFVLCLLPGVALGIYSTTLYAKLHTYPSSYVFEQLGILP